jgi:hypothetical protein
MKDFIMLGKIVVGSALLVGFAYIVAVGAIVTVYSALGWI